MSTLTTEAAYGNPAATQLSLTRLLWLAFVPAAVILSPATARSDEPGRVLAPEDAGDRVWRSPFFKDTTLDLHPRTYYFVRDNFDGSRIRPGPAAAGSPTIRVCWAISSTSVQRSTPRSRLWLRTMKAARCC